MVILENFKNNVKIVYFKFLTKITNSYTAS